jgi:hypothetical protein
VQQRVRAEALAVGSEEISAGVAGATRAGSAVERREEVSVIAGYSAAGAGAAPRVQTAAAAVTPDTDNDGLLDGVDSTPTNPANGHADANADGTPNGLASLLATPGQRDTDRDAVSDFVESAVTRTNPFNPDTDGDSLPDGWEIKEQLDPNNPSGADGPQGDPDGDGKTNAEEWVLGTRPHTAN